MINSNKIISVAIHIFLITLFSMIMFHLSPGIAAEKSQKALIVSYDNWPPFTDETVPDHGICFAIANAAFKSTCYKIQPRMIPFKRADLYLRKGIEIDASSYYWYNAERAGFLYFSDPLLYNNIHFFVRSDSKISFNQLEDLKGLNIGIIRGYYNGEAFDNAAYLKKYVCSENKQAIQMLIMGRLDLVVLDSVVAQTIMHRLKIKDRLRALPKPLFTAGLHFVVSKKNPDGKNIIRVFNAGLQRIRGNGEYQKIMDTHGILNNRKMADD